ncbi:MAG TPA: class I SAM-dependent methyltransferase [Candidatus Binatia bacterium]|jgi:arsenite methyltransferase|nr:class I SAM-dependent methyltransferase [Candidatus Binatia bacterium]
MGTQTKPDYGLDAPGVVRRLLFFGLLLILAGVGLLIAGGRTRFLLWPGWSFVCGGIAQAATGAAMLWGSRVGKLGLRDQLLASLPWRGDERVLDVGCGHGLFLIGAAKRLTGGSAVGLDLWQAEDQAGNSREATMRNATLEGVGDRINLRDGDARQMPFANESFDLVLSSWALHNIYEPAGRRSALKEIVRVLKPGGRVAIVDIRHCQEYAVALANLGLVDVHLSGPHFIFVIPSRSVSAVKPLRGGMNAERAEAGSLKQGH